MHPRSCRRRHTLGSSDVPQNPKVPVMVLSMDTSMSYWPGRQPVRDKMRMNRARGASPVPSPSGANMANLQVVVPFWMDGRGEPRCGDGTGRHVIPGVLWCERGWNGEESVSRPKLTVNGDDDCERYFSMVHTTSLSCATQRHLIRVAMLFMGMTPPKRGSANARRRVRYL